MVETGEEREMSSERFEGFEGTRGFEVGADFGGVEDGSVKAKVGSDANEAFRFGVRALGWGLGIVCEGANGFQNREG
jgi:hypothetical protein